MKTILGWIEQFNTKQVCSRGETFGWICASGGEPLTIERRGLAKIIAATFASSC